jgi:hypothetical protein
MVFATSIVIFLPFVYFYSRDTGILGCYNFEKIRYILKGKTPMEYWQLALKKYI